MIVFDYNKAMAQVRELRQIASDMNKTKNGTLAEAISGARTGWQGSNGDTFNNKCSTLNNLISNEVNNINSVANSLERTAIIIDRTEREAVRIATMGIVK